eukprot:gene18231-20049_t
MSKSRKTLNAAILTTVDKQDTKGGFKKGAQTIQSLPKIPNGNHVPRPPRFKSPDKQNGRKREKGSSNSLKKSSSDSLVASFRNLNISSRASSRLSAIPSRSGQRYLSTLTVPNVDEFANLIKSNQCKNIIVMAGAGISTPSGIPDFRSPGIGLYDNLDEYHLPDPTSVFDIDFFKYNPTPFFKLAKEIYPGNYAPNIVHHFVKLLHDKGFLLRIYTQNIDALEQAAGIPKSKLVEAHGSFATATCRRCRTNYKGEEIWPEIERQEVPKCRQLGCSGVIKPDIVFFGEDLPRRFFLYPKDFAKCDMLIVMGTSLKVEPFAGLANEASRSAPRLLINRDIVGPFVRRKKRANDVIIKGDIVAGVNKLLTALSWKKECEALLERYKEEHPQHGQRSKDS